MLIPRLFQNALLGRYRDWLVERELAPNTVSKYTRDVRRMLEFVSASPVPSLSKKSALMYKSDLVERYAPASVNSMIAAANSFFKFLGKPELSIKQLRIQRRTYLGTGEELTRDDYLELLAAAEEQGDGKAKLMLETLCSTGMRVGELKFVTAEALADGFVSINMKGKVRIAWIPEELKSGLEALAEREGIRSGALFRSKNGVALHRTYVWKRMKSLGEAAGVDAAKVYPHNLRHLFARTFYSAHKDISALSDVLGHSSLATTKIYTMTSGRECRQQLAHLGLVA